jgi:hypothetical protein
VSRQRKDRVASRHELVCVTATLTYQARTVINADLSADAGVLLEPNDQLRRLRGVGGHEHVFVRQVERFAVGDHGINAFVAEIGEMDYGFAFGGIIAMDFLRAAPAATPIDGPPTA